MSELPKAARAPSTGDSRVGVNTDRRPQEDDRAVARAIRSARSDALRYAPSRFVPALVSLAAVPLLTAAIKPSDYGAYYLVSSAASLLSYISVGWIQSAAVRFYWPRRREQRLDEYTATTLWATVLSLVSTAVVVGIAAWFARGRLADNIVKLVPAALVYLVINFLTDVLAQVLRAAKQAATFAKVQVLGALLSTGASIVLVWWGHVGAAGIFAGGALGWTITLLPILRAVKRQGSLSPGRIRRGTLADFWTYGLPLVPVGIATWALVLVDRFVVGAFSGSAQVGLYSVGYQMGQRIIQLVTTPLVLTMLPSLTEAFEHQGFVVAQRTQTGLVRLFALLTFPVLAGLAALSQPIMRLLTATEYWSAWPVLAIVAGGSVFSAFSQIATAGLALQKKTKLIMVNTVAAACFNVVANFALVPFFGYIAAAYDTLAAWVLSMALAWWQCRRHMPLRLPWRNLASIAVASIVMGFAVWLLFGRISTRVSRPATLGVLAAEAAAAAIIYVALLVALREVRPRAREWLRRAAAGVADHVVRRRG